MRTKMILFALVFSILALAGAAYVFMHWQDSQARSKQVNCQSVASYDEDTGFCD